MIGAFAVAAGLVGLLLGPWLAATTVRLASRDHRTRSAPARVVATCLASAAALGAAPALVGLRPAAVGLAWFGGAAVVLAGVDLACHRLPDRVSYPAAVVVAAALLADAAVTGSWPALVRAAVSAVAAFAVATAAAAVSPEALGYGDVKLLGLLGLVLGWAGWGVLLGGVFAGLLVGAAASLVLLANRRVGWRTAVPFGPPLIVGAYVALVLAGPLPGA